MAEVRIIVDHWQLEYKGLFELNGFFRTVDQWMFECGMEKTTHINQEIETPEGKFIEWRIAPWKKLSDYNKMIIRVRALMYNLKNVEVMVDKKKRKLTEGKIIIYIDGFIEQDYEHRWDDKPFLLFIRTMMDKFVHRAYTERFEARITYHCHQLYSILENYFNVYRQTIPLYKQPHFAYPQNG